jgi:CubicO group peptidase (beta-lactamase class C family)
MKLLQNKRSIAFCVVAVFIFLISCYSHVAASVEYYPTKGWKVTAPEDQGIQSKSLLAMLENIQENGYNIQSISIIRNGYLVMDSYVHPFAESQKHEMFSTTKSIISALIGIAIDKGYIKDVNQTLAELFPNRKISNLDGLKQTITLKNLLMMASGLNCNDGWEKNWAGVFEMMKSNDWVQYTLDLPMEKTPGEWFDYCNGVSHLLSAAISESTGMKTIEFAKKYLFDPLGIVDIKWDTDPGGTNIGFSRMSLQPKDMAKFGLLYLNKGKWEDKQIISAEWVEASTRPYLDGRLGGSKYGYQWWVNPAGYYAALGMYGQTIFVVPEKNLVAVFTGNIEGENMFVSGKLLREYIIPASVSDKPISSDQESTARLNKMIETLAEAPSDGVIWMAKNEGLAKDGIFKRMTTPSFSFQYPLGSTKVLTNSPLQIMRMTTPEGVSFNASLAKIPEGINLEEFGPKYMTSVLQEFGTDVKVISNKEIKLKCGSRAYRTDITWNWMGTYPLTSLIVSAYKEGQCVWVAVHPMGNPEKFVPIVQSLSLK